MILHLSYCRMLRSWLSAEIGLLLCAILFLSPASGLAAKPNILMILADDLGYGDLSSYGATDLQSPNIDGLVKSGLRMDNFYANCPVCSPTRASLLTGRHPELVGVPGVVRTDPLPCCTIPIEAECSFCLDSHHPIISLQGSPSAVIVFRILHPILASTLCDANPLARIAGPKMIL